MNSEELLERVRRELEPFARERGMELHVQAEAARGTMVRVDPQALEQILFNLVDNSCKYASGSTDSRLEIEARPRDSVLEILYRDHGPGILAEDRKKIFTAFRRGQRDSQVNLPGLGMGLALARGLARQAGGDLQLDGREQEGVVFLLTLPLCG